MGAKFSHLARCPQDVKYEKGRQASSTSEEKTGISSENLSSKSEVNLENIHSAEDFEPMESFQYLKRSELTGSMSEYSIRLNSPSLNSQDLNSPSVQASDTLSAINDLLSLCESGNGPSLSYLLENHDILNEVINDYHECHVGDRQMNITPLMLAAACGYPHIVEEFLVVPSVQLNLKSGDIYGQTALHIAVSLGQLKCVQALAASPNVDINAVDTLKMTPLHVATYGRFDEAIELLLERSDVDCGLQDSNGNNIFHIGALSNNVSAIKSILKYASMTDFCEIYRYGDHSPSEDLSYLRRPDMGSTLRQLTEALNNDGLNVGTILHQNIAGLKSPSVSGQQRTPGYLEMFDDAHKCLVLYTRAPNYPSILKHSMTLAAAEEYSPQEDLTTALSWSPRAVLKENGSYIKMCSPLSH